MAEWINKGDIVNGIAALLKAGKTLPGAERINAIKEQVNQGISPDVVAQKVKQEKLRMIDELAEQWLDILVPAEEYRMAFDKPVTLERFQLAIKESLKLKDFKKVLDIALVIEGMEKADAILQAVRIQKEKEVSKPWQVEVATSNDRYRGMILSRWTAARIKNNAMPIKYLSYLSESLEPELLRANYNKLLDYGRKMFPKVSDSVLKENLMLLAMQHSNETFCRECKNCYGCYSEHHNLLLRFDGERFKVSASPDFCKKYSNKIKNTETTINTKGDRL